MAEMQHGMVVDGHLGGYVPGGDPATWYPSLWKALVTDLGVTSVIDVGCGDGVAVSAFEQLGCRVLGIDGIPQEHLAIIEHDYTTGPFVPAIDTEPPDRFDLCWSCEFVEHVEERYVENFLATFACADVVLMTHAGPGQAGWHHVNCQPSSYWIDKLLTVGLLWDEGLSEWARSLARMNPSPWNHFARSGLAFRNGGASG